MLEPKLVQNHYIDQNLAKCSPETTKNCQFFLKTAIFSKFAAPLAPEFVLLTLKKGHPKFMTFYGYSSGRS